jgi:hypothetical protein
MIKWLSKKYNESVHLAIYAGNKAVFIINNQAGGEGSAFPKPGLRCLPIVPQLARFSWLFRVRRKLKST